MRSFQLGAPGRKHRTSETEIAPFRYDANEVVKSLHRPGKITGGGAVRPPITVTSARARWKTVLATNPSEANDEVHIDVDGLIRDNRELLRFRA